ncbi:reverse transcriptase [Escherichia coli]|nr:reverse transcriptase [Escherichia coli]MBC0898493.1 reverse transcriptase [Escherichia coli]
MTIEVQRREDKFEIKPGVWVYVPSVEARKVGGKILQAVRNKWIPPLYFYHLRTGGHLKAARLHLKSDFFAVVDIKQFFQSTSRSRITRDLKSYFTYSQAREISTFSTVRNLSHSPHKHVLPFGFVQSPILATLCLDKSYFGSLLRRLNKHHDLKLSVFMDDVIISSNDLAQLQAAYDEALVAMRKSGYQANMSKTQAPSSKISVFNLTLSKGVMKVTSQKMSDFLIDFYSSNYEPHRIGVKNYVEAVNPGQAKLFKL